MTQDESEKICGFSVPMTAKDCEGKQMSDQKQNSYNRLAAGLPVDDEKVKEALEWADARWGHEPQSNASILAQALREAQAEIRDERTKRDRCIDGLSKMVDRLEAAEVRIQSLERVEASRYKLKQLAALDRLEDSSEKGGA